MNLFVLLWHTAAATLAMPCSTVLEHLQRDHIAKIDAIVIVMSKCKFNMAAASTQSRGTA